MMAEGTVPLSLHLQVHLSLFFNLTPGNKGEMFVGLMGKRTLGGGETTLSPSLYVLSHWNSIIQQGWIIL